MKKRKPYLPGVEAVLDLKAAGIGVPEIAVRLRRTEAYVAKRLSMFNHEVAKVETAESMRRRIPENQRPKKRACIVTGCNRTFMSQHAGHRICPHCERFRVHHANWSLG